MQLVVSGLLHRFHNLWTPEYFSPKYGTQSCLILECQTEQNKRVTVAEFFALFGKYEGRRDCWKLKVRGALVAAENGPLIRALALSLSLPASCFLFILRPLGGCV